MGPDLSGCVAAGVCHRLVGWSFAHEGLSAISSGFEVVHQGQLALCWLLVHKSPRLEDVGIRVGDVLCAIALFQHKASVGHAAHQAGGLLESGGHCLKAGAVGSETCFFPGEVRHFKAI